VGCNFCLAKQHGYKNILSSTHYKNLFSAVLAAGILVTGISLSLAIHSNRYWPHNPGFLLSTLSQLLTHINIMLSVLYCQKTAQRISKSQSIQKQKFSSSVTI